MSNMLSLKSRGVKVSFSKGFSYVGLLCLLRKDIGLILPLRFEFLFWLRLDVVTVELLKAPVSLEVAIFLKKIKFLKYEKFIYG